jgi:hypothetical protein
MFRERYESLASMSQIDLGEGEEVVEEEATGKSMKSNSNPNFETASQASTRQPGSASGSSSSSSASSPVITASGEPTGSMTATNSDSSNPAGGIQVSNSLTVDNNKYSGIDASNLKESLLEGGGSAGNNKEQLQKELSMQMAMQERESNTTWGGSSGIGGTCLPGRYVAKMAGNYLSTTVEVILKPLEWAIENSCPDCRILEPKENW